VACAFASDPAWRFLFGAGYKRLAPEFAGALFDLRVAQGTVWVARYAVAVAMWDAPKTRDPEPSADRKAFRRFDSLADSATRRRLSAYDDAIKQASPRQPFWYLGVLATHPAHQRQGLASAVLEPALRDASAHRLPCFLETSTQPNRRFYERRGFQVADEITLAGGPPTWWMRRPANAEHTDARARPA
jgi:GNAT superfamily N-acetyltransferase